MSARTACHDPGAARIRRTEGPLVTPLRRGARALARNALEVVMNETRHAFEPYVESFFLAADRLYPEPERYMTTSGAYL